MAQLRQDQLESVREALDDGAQSIHISGQPGVGKSTFLSDLADTLSEPDEVRTLHVREGNSPTTLTQDLLHKVRDAVGTLSRFFNSISGASGGISVMGFGANAGATLDDRTRHLQKLASLSDSISSRNRLVLCIDDVHKLDDPEVTRDFLRELSNNLGENVHLVTAGRLMWDDAEQTLHLDTFSRDETATYLREEYPDVDSAAIDSVYEKIEGHPYYLGLLTGVAESDMAFELPQEDAYDFIEEAYLNSLSEEEEAFLRHTSGLTELDEEICATVLDGVSRTQARRILDSLSDKAVVSDLGRSEETGVRIYTVHDLFQEFLYDRLDDPEAIHRAAFQYYADKLHNTVEDSSAPALEGFAFAMLGNVHLEHIYEDGPNVEQIRTEIDHLGLGPEDRLRFAMGYAPYAPSSESDYSDVIAYELDDFRNWLQTLEPDTEDDQLQIEMLTVMVNLFRAHQRSVSDSEFEETSLEIYEDTISGINETDFGALFSTDDKETIELFPDILELACHFSAMNSAEDDDVRYPHRDAAYEILEDYGLDRAAVEGFLQNCRELQAEYEAGEQAEEFIENRVEAFFEDFDENDVTRTALIRMQSELLAEMTSWANSAFTAMVTESDRLLEFVHDCGDSLAEAENPFFVAVWYSITTQAFGTFAPEADSTKELEETFQHYAKQRKDYEEQIENSLIEMEEFEADDIEFPDVVDEITEMTEDPELLEE